MNIFDINQDEISLLKNIYEYCVAVKWNQEKLEELALILKIDGITLKQWARIYAKKSITKEEHSLFSEKNTNIRIIELEKMKLKLNDTIEKKHKTQRGLSTGKKNPIIYQEKNKVLYRLWETEDEKQIVLKYIYNICEENFYSDEIIEKLAEWFGISSKSVIPEYAKKYALDYLGQSKEEYETRRRECVQKKLENYYKNLPNKTKIVYEKLLEAKKLEDIILIIESSHADIKVIQSSLRDYIRVHRQNDLKIEKELKEKLMIYTEYKNKLNKEIRENVKKEKREQQFEIKKQLAIKYVSLFLEEENKNIDYFCKKNNIDKTLFEEYILILKEQNHELYIKYSEKTSKEKSQRYAVIVNKTINIITYLKMGIEENGIVRSFDLIDYYMNIKISLDNILIVAKDIVSQRDMILLRKFVQQNISGINSNYNDIKMIMSEIVEFNMKKDNKGMPIPGTGEIFSNEQKMQIIEYLKENNIPINRKTYSLAFKRYKEGFLNFEVKKTKKLVLK